MHGSERAAAEGAEVIFVSNSQSDMSGYQVGSSAQSLIRPMFIVRLPLSNLTNLSLSHECAFTSMCVYTSGIFVFPGLDLIKSPDDRSIVTTHTCRPPREHASLSIQINLFNSSVSSPSVHLYISDQWSHVKVSRPRQEGVKSLISPPQKKFLLEASLCWFPAFLPNALFLLFGALDYQGQLFPCH